MGAPLISNSRRRMEIRERYVHQDLENGDTHIVQHEHGTVSSAAEYAQEERERGHNIVWSLFGFVEALVGLRFLFQLFGARDTGFASFVYDISSPFVAPFQGVFSAPNVVGTGNFDSAAFLALLVFPLVAWAINGLIELVIRPMHTPSLR